MGGSTQTFDWIFFGIMIPPVLYAAWDMFQTGGSKVSYESGGARPGPKEWMPGVEPERGGARKM